MVLAILAEDGAVGIHDDRRVVVDPRHVLLVDRQDHDEVELFCELREALDDGAVGRFGIVVILGVFCDAEVRTVEQLLEADDLRTLSGRIARELLVLGDHGFLVAGPCRLGDRCAYDSHRESSIAVPFCYCAP